MKAGGYSMEKLYTVEEVAKQLSVTGRTIRNYLKSGRLVGRKIGGQWRFPESEVQRLLNGSGPEMPEFQSIQAIQSMQGNIEPSSATTFSFYNEGEQEYADNADDTASSITLNDYANSDYQDFPAPAPLPTIAPPSSLTESSVDSAAPKDNTKPFNPFSARPRSESAMPPPVENVKRYVQPSIPPPQKPEIRPAKPRTEEPAAPPPTSPHRRAGQGAAHNPQYNKVISPTPPANPPQVNIQIPSQEYQSVYDVVPVTPVQSQIPAAEQAIPTPVYTTSVPQTPTESSPPAYIGRSENSNITPSSFQGVPSLNEPSSKVYTQPVPQQPVAPAPQLQPQPIHTTRDMAATVAQPQMSEAAFTQNVSPPPDNYAHRSINSSVSQQPASWPQQEPVPQNSPAVQANYPVAAYPYQPIPGYYYPYAAQNGYAVQAPWYPGVVPAVFTSQSTSTPDTTTVTDAKSPKSENYNDASMYDTSNSVPELSDVGKLVLKFVSEVHDCTQGSFVCSVFDLFQPLNVAKSTSERLASIAEQESKNGILCKSYVEFDDRYLLARYTLLGSSAFLSRCMQILS